MTQLSSLTMIIVSHFLDYVKDGIRYITGDDKVFCPNPDCGCFMNLHGRCRRFVRRPAGLRDELSLRVLYCPKCNQYHRELPDFVVPYKHLCADIIAAIYDALDTYCVDDHTATRICRWVKIFFRIGAATVGRLKLEHPTLVTNCDAFSTLDKLRYFVKVVVKMDEWQSTSSRILSG